MTQYKEIRLNLPFELRNMVEKVVLAYKKPKTKVIVDLLWLLHDNPKLLSDKFPTAFSGKTVGQIAKDLREGNLTDASAQTNSSPPSPKSSKQVLPNFVITTEKPGRVRPETKAYISYYAKERPKYHFDLFYGASMLRITAFEKSVEVDVKDETAFHNALQSLPQALYFNAYWEDYTVYFTDRPYGETSDIGPYNLDDARALTHAIETLVLDNDFETALDMAAKWVQENPRNSDDN